MRRRRFILKAGGALAAAGAAAVVDAPSVIAQPKVQWRLSTTWTPALDVLQGSAEQLARLVDEGSGGRFALERLKAEFQGKVEVVQLPAPVLRDLKKLASQVVREESEKSPMATKVYGSYMKFQAQHTGWSRISEGAYQQHVAM